VLGKQILITGSRGLIGQTLIDRLHLHGWRTREYDIRLDTGQDVRSSVSLQRAVTDCAGIVHLAAVSRVVWGEQDPVLCHDTNVVGTRKVVHAALEVGSAPPWVLFASSREVYGEPPRLPATESDSLSPINEYGRTKVAAERLIESAARDGLVTGIVRLSNVYGRSDDYPDRVVPAFARAAATGTAMRVDGANHLFDFTHVEDTVAGILKVIEQLEAGQRGLPPIHLLTGQPTSLGELAALANQAGGGRSDRIDAPPRSYDVARFWGDPARARALLGWSATIGIADGVAQLVSQYAKHLGTRSLA
jgi:UDP-glucose 4-epimerase